MKIKLTPEEITKRLKIVNELRKMCLSLANSSAGRSIQEINSANQSVQRTSHALGRSSMKTHTKVI